MAHVQVRTQYRTTPGHHLYRLPTGQWRYCTPDGRFVKVSGDEVTLQAVDTVLTRAWDAEGRPDGGSAETPAAVSALLEDLVVRGVVERVRTDVAPPDPDGAQAPGTGMDVRVEVLVEGDGPVSHAVAQLLAPRAVVVRGNADRDTAVRAAVLISCADRLPDRRWTEVDRWCRESGTAWHRIHPEGLRWCLGPLSVPGGPGYLDVRGRILAASPWADELAGLWHHLDTATDPAPAITAGTAAALAGALVADVEALLDGRPVPGAGHQVLHDPGTGTWTRHPVLPLPVTAPAPGTAPSHTAPLPAAP